MSTLLSGQEEGDITKQIKSLALLLVLSLALAAVTLLIGKGPKLASKAAGENAKLSFSSSFANTSLTETVGESFTVPIYLSTDGADIRGVDATILFDGSKISLTDIAPEAAAVTSLKTFLPVVAGDPNGVFDKAKVINTANSQQKIEFGAVTFSWLPPPGKVESSFNGSALLATLTFTALQATGGSPALLTFNFNSAANTTDTNVVNTSGNDLIAANSQLNNLSLTINSALIPGDANEDNRVDGIDYIAWLVHYGQATVNGHRDGNFNETVDQVVDGIDYIIWLTHYGQG